MVICDDEVFFEKFIECEAKCLIKMKPRGPHIKLMN